MSMRRPIGVFDSGVGGLTVVRALRAALPGEDIVYLGDTARVPYGSKSPRTVERYSLACQAFLLARDVKLVLIACNTASANALPALRAASPVPVIGAVEPGAERAIAATRSGDIGVIGTLGTVRSGAYERAIAARRADTRVRAMACPLFVPLAEEGWTDDEIAVAVARRYLAQLFAADRANDERSESNGVGTLPASPAGRRQSPRGIDTLVLGCTHYPLLRGVLERTAAEVAGREIAIVDSATAMAEAARHALELDHGDNRRGTAGRLDCFATDTSRLDELAARFLGEQPTGFELVDL